MMADDSWCACQIRKAHIVLEGNDTFVMKFEALVDHNYKENTNVYHLLV